MGKVIVETKQSWFEETRDKFVSFCKRHPDIILTVIGGTFSLAGAIVNYMSTQNEYKDNVYMTDGNDVYKIPAKSMNSKKLKTVN